MLRWLNKQANKHILFTLGDFFHSRLFISSVNCVPGALNCHYGAYLTAVKYADHVDLFKDQNKMVLHLKHRKTPRTDYNLSRMSRSQEIDFK